MIRIQTGSLWPKFEITFFIPDMEENRNWVDVESFDNSGNTMSKSRSYLDGLGRGTQQQAIDITNGNVLALLPAACPEIFRTAFSGIFKHNIVVIAVRLMVWLVIKSQNLYDVFFLTFLKISTGIPLLVLGSGPDGTQN